MSAEGIKNEQVREKCGYGNTGITSQSEALVASNNAVTADQWSDADSSLFSLFLQASVSLWKNETFQCSNSCWTGPSPLILTDTMTHCVPGAVSIS